MADGFQSQLNAFKKSLKTQSTLPAQRRIVQPVTPAAPPVTAKPVITKRPASAAINDLDDDDDDEDEDGYKKPKNNGTLSIRLMTASDYIKSTDRPVPIDELEKHMKTRLDSQLLKVLSNVDRIKYDPVSRCFEYLSLHNIKTAEDLLKVLENQPTFQGLSVKQLRDGWNGCIETIAQLEKEHKIIVYKTKKEHSPRHIWLNAEGIPVGGIVDPEFVDMWKHIKTPKSDELVQTLLDNNLTPTNIDPNTIRKKVAPTQERKQKKPRRGKVTNTHMKGILKDYSSRV